MADRPILFSAPMVRAILDGRKTMTRRIVRLHRHHDIAIQSVGTPLGDEWRYEETTGRGRACGVVPCPFGAPGDRLWVRERFAALDEHGNRCAPRDAAFALLADGAQVFRDGSYFPGLPHYAAGAFDRIMWRPSIHMPRWAARVELELLAVRVERLQSITEADAQAEGVEPIQMDGGSYLPRFEGLWDSINGKRAPWASNPWVWVVEFRPQQKGEKT